MWGSSIVRMRSAQWTPALVSGRQGSLLGAGAVLALLLAVGRASLDGATAQAGRSDGHGELALSASEGRAGLGAATLYRRVRPSLVTVDTTVVGGGRRESGEGTGITLDTFGRILTNDHVVSDVSEVTVRVASGRTYAARIVKQDSQGDLAVLQIDAPPSALHPTRLGDSSTLTVGEPVLAIGNGLGYEPSLNEGIHGRLDRIFDPGRHDEMQHLIQSDAAVNPGNSGGPLINSRGEVVGINKLLDNADQSDNFSGIGLAIVIDRARELIRQVSPVVR